MKHPNESSAGGSGPIQFPPTLWTVVLEAKQAEPERAQEAMGKLCVHYQEAILGYFRLKCRHHHDAEDLASAFMAHILEQSRLASFDRDKCARFRAFLSSVLKNFFLDWLEKRNAAKRGDGKPDDSIEALRESGVDFSANEAQHKHSLDLELARLVHRRVMASLETAASDPNRFQVLRDFVPFEHGQATYEAAAKRLKLSGPTLRKAVFDLRKNYAQKFRIEVAPTVRDVRVELDNEASELLDLLTEAVVLDSQQHS